MKNERFGGRSFLLSWKESFLNQFLSDLDCVCGCSLAEIVGDAPEVQTVLD